MSIYDYIEFIYAVKDSILIYLGFVEAPYTDVELDEILKKYLIRIDDEDFYEF